MSQGGGTRVSFDWQRSLFDSFVELIIADGFHVGTEKLVSFCCRSCRGRIIFDADGMEEDLPP